MTCCLHTTIFFNLLYLPMQCPFGARAWSCNCAHLSVVVGRVAGFRTDHQTIAGLTHRDRQPFTLTFTPTGNSESTINLTCMSLDCGRKLEYPERVNNRMNDCLLPAHTWSIKGSLHHVIAQPYSPIPFHQMPPPGQVSPIHNLM